MRQACGPNGDAASNATDRGREPRQQHRALNEAATIEMGREPMSIFQRAARQSDDGSFLVVGSS